MNNCLVIYLEGVPATGKSTVFRHIREKAFQGCEAFKSGLLRGIKKGAMQMFGVFDGSTFEGTDRLSMTVINDTIPYIKNLQQSSERSVVFIEGARLANTRFLNEAKALLFLLYADNSTLEARHFERGDKQTERFLKSRETQVSNLAKNYKARWIDNSSGCSEQIANSLIEFANKWIERR